METPKNDVELLSKEIQTLRGENKKIKDVLNKIVAKCNQLENQPKPQASSQVVKVVDEVKYC